MGRACTHEDICKLEGKQNIVDIMKILLCFAVLLVAVTLLQTQVEAAAAIELVQPHPDYPGKCYHSSTKKAYAVGETWTSDKQCVQYKCSNSPDTGLVIETTGCSPLAVKPPCTVVQGTSNTRYPTCCPKKECPKQ